ncbi:MULTISPECIES: hypothetical protein [Streptosporangium]|uniref:K+-sensing histidine kinase KdpD n=1 Tax=Streptosporangium brasiliense TaxID=47480 RepID=A0ABT9RDG4_9ACTN|nr:hypothetical protein [Streptosporangium brasiliense]MDP9866916.1 K+-sensing histidine kinase KdpD [Streptosporangium brasiliense]
METRGRPRTAALLDGMEVLPRKTLVYRGTAFTELDVDSVLARNPKIVLIDELVHINVPGSPNAKRWQDIEEGLSLGSASPASK